MAKKTGIEIEYRRSGMTEEAESFGEALEKIRQMFPGATIGGLIIVKSVKEPKKVVATIHGTY